MVEKKQLIREVNQSFAFLKGLEPTSSQESYEAPTNKAFAKDSLSTLQVDKTKQRFEVSVDGLEKKMKSLANTIANLT